MDEDVFQYHLQRLTEEDSFSRLIEAGDEILPKLEVQFRLESSPTRRAALTNVIWEHRNASSLPFLAHALDDPCECVWQQALDGLITIGGEEAKESLCAALPVSDDYKAKYIIEALDQMSAANAESR